MGVEAYAAYALRAWLARDQVISVWTRGFAKWSAICSFALGMAGQVAYHLLAQAGIARAPWAITTVVSGLPVLVLGMGTALAHMLRADAADTPDSRTGQPATLRSMSWSLRTGRGQVGGSRRQTGTGPHGGTRMLRSEDQRMTVGQRTGVLARAAADGPGPHSRPSPRGSGEACITAGVAQRRNHRLQPGLERASQHNQRRVSRGCRQQAKHPASGGLPGQPGQHLAQPRRYAGNRGGVSAARSSGRCRTPTLRAVPVVRGGTGQLLQRRGLQLTDALAANAKLGCEAVVGAPGGREGTRGEDQPLPFLKLI
jgi:hypothetical protein